MDAILSSIPKQFNMEMSSGIDLHFPGMSLLVFLLRTGSMNNPSIPGILGPLI